MRDDNSRTWALLIDADNSSPKIAAGLFAEAVRHGTIGVARIYTDWTLSASRGWKECLALYAIQPVQQFAYRAGKNATDSAMVIDAMDLLHTDRFCGFCLVSSDSDFARLALRIRQEGIRVHGFGERHTPHAFVNACDRFVYLDTLRPAEEQPETGGTPLRKLIASRSIMAAYREETEAEHSLTASARTPMEPLGFDHPVFDMIEEAVFAVADDQDRATLANVGTQLLKQVPGFDCRRYGYAKLSDLVEDCPFLEVERAGEIMQAITVRLIPIHSDAPPPKTANDA